MEVRFFAGAAEAAGTPSRVVEVPAGATVAELVDSLTAGDDVLSRVMDVSSLLLDGTRVTDRTNRVGDAAQLDVLPPFAGG